MKDFVRSEQDEAAVARCLINNKPVPDTKLWHKRGKPTVYNAVCNLAPSFGIVSTREQVRRAISPNGQSYYVATVTAKRGNNSRVGAAVSCDEKAVTLLAFRNAITALI